MSWYLFIVVISIYCVPCWKIGHPKFHNCQFCAPSLYIHAKTLLDPASFFLPCATYYWSRRGTNRWHIALETKTLLDPASFFLPCAPHYWTRRGTNRWHIPLETKTLLDPASFFLPCAPYNWTRRGTNRWHIPLEPWLITALTRTEQRTPELPSGIDFEFSCLGSL